MTIDARVDDFWKGRRVLVTGHTGFKGSWLSLWLRESGAEVSGYALAPNTTPNLFDAARVGELVDSRLGDIRDSAALEAAIEETQPEVILHLAAQPLVRLSYSQPVETFSTNVMGTVNVLEATRKQTGVRAVVVVTSDKCYENREWEWAYREDEPMGGHDPYSCSKGCAELVTASYRRSFFSTDGTATIASVRAGNVIGGGDWAGDRLVPDCIRAIAAGESIHIRSPLATRPWQHVLEPLSGYLDVARRLLAGDRRIATAFNFGPDVRDAWPVKDIVAQIVDLWGDGANWTAAEGDHLHEANYLKVDSSRANSLLGWSPKLGLNALEWTVEWYRSVAAGRDARDATLEQIRRYVETRMIDHGTPLPRLRVA